MTVLDGAIDYWCNAFTRDRLAAWHQAISNQGLGLKIERAGDEFCEPATMVERMDAAGFGTVILVASDHRDAVEVDSFEHVAARDHEIRALAENYPGRFKGLWSVDPTRGQADVDHAAAMAAEPWCVGLHNHTHSWDRPFDHPDFAPYYQLSAAEGLPFVMQAGASGGDFPHECGRPEGIRRPATEHPNVNFVLSHTGAPWTADTIAVAREFDNVFIGTASWPLAHWPAELLSYAESDGASRVLYGSGFPTTGHAQAARQFARSDLDPDLIRRITTDNARSVFTRLDSPTSTPNPA